MSVLEWHYTFHVPFVSFTASYLGSHGLKSQPSLAKVCVIFPSPSMQLLALKSWP